MVKTREQLEQRKAEVLAFLSKHYKKDKDQFNNFVSKYPNYSDNGISTDESSEANEFADYESQIAVEHALEDELMEIEEQLKELDK